LSDAPRVSFIILSYNYEKYIVKTIQSVLDQTFRDFEVIVVDDASSDRSCEVVRSFDDSRIRLYFNEKNLGGSASYNRAVGLCRGEYLVNLDADDWIDRRKTEIQLQAFARTPALDILGTYVLFVDPTGNKHSQSTKFEAATNRPYDFNLIGTWVVSNSLCRSSTMFRRSVHDRIGAYEPTMVRAPDYELWTRALREGCRFGIVEEPLTFYRMHSEGLTRGDLPGTFLEICYLLLKNLVPMIEKRATFDCFCRIVSWIVPNEQFAALQPEERYRLLGAMITSPALQDFKEFRQIVLGNAGDPVLTSVGRRLLVAFNFHPGQQFAERLIQDIDKYIEARDYWHMQSDALEREYRKLESFYEREKYRFAEGGPLSAGILARRLLKWIRKKGTQWETGNGSG
jgi:glycosyltransferase involved in cell wall biosynthesis